jgi:hypothetical protein
MTTRLKGKLVTRYPLAPEHFAACACNDVERFSDQLVCNPQFLERGLEMTGYSVEVNVAQPLIGHQLRVCCA